MIAQQSGNTTEAEADYAKAIATAPTFESALYNDGVLRFQAGDLTGAASLLTRAVAAKPQDGNARRVLAQVLVYTKHT